MQVVFRADASVHIGSGHIIRCLCLADALAQHGAQIRFVVRHITDYLKKLIVDRGFQLSMLKEQSAASDELFHSTWLGVSQQDDAEKTLQILQDYHQTIEWLIVDHYALDQRWERILRPAVDKIMVIDDLADRIHDCDLLLDQNQYLDLANRYHNKVPVKTQLLLGARYALLRDEFRIARHKKQLVFTVKVKKIMVFFGGMDKDNYTGKLLRSLDHSNFSLQYQLIVVVGAQHPDLLYIQGVCKQYHYECHINSTEMATLMLKADMAIGAGGSASWERCALGLPSLAIAVATNQQLLTKHAALQSLIDSPIIDWNNVVSIRQAVMGMIDNPLARQRIAQTSWQTVDGRGVQRVLRAMGIYSVQVRKAELSDSHSLWMWRNHDSIRLVSRHTEIIPLESHQQWFEQTLLSTDRIILIAELASEPVGVIRFDFSGISAEISIYCVPDAKGSGNALEMLQQAEHYLQYNHIQIKLINAVVLAENQSSHHLFINAGYQKKSTTYLKNIERS